MSNPNESSRSVRTYYANGNHGQAPIYINNNTNNNNNSNNVYPVTGSMNNGRNVSHQYYSPYEMKNGDGSQHSLPQQFSMSSSSHPQYRPLVPQAGSHYSSAPSHAQYANNNIMRSQQTSPHAYHQHMENDTHHNMQSIPMINKESNSNSYQQHQQQQQSIYGIRSYNGNYYNNTNAMVSQPQDYRIQQQHEYVQGVYNNSSMDTIYDAQAQLFRNPGQFSIQAPSIHRPGIPHQTASSFSPSRYEIPQPAMSPPRPPSHFQNINHSNDIYIQHQQATPILPQPQAMSPQFAVPFVPPQQSPQQQLMNRFSSLHEKDERENQQSVRNIFIPVNSHSNSTNNPVMTHRPAAFQNAESFAPNNFESGSPEKQRRFEFVRPIMAAPSYQPPGLSLQQQVQPIFNSEANTVNSSNLPKPVRLQFHNETIGQIALRNESKNNSKLKKTGNKPSVETVRTNISQQVKLVDQNYTPNSTTPSLKKSRKLNDLLSLESSTKKADKDTVSTVIPKSLVPSKAAKNTNKLSSLLSSNQKPPVSLKNIDKMDDTVPSSKSQHTQGSIVESQPSFKSSKFSSIFHDEASSTNVPKNPVNANTGSVNKIRLSSLSSLLEDKPTAPSKVCKFTSMMGGIDSDDDDDSIKNEKDNIDIDNDNDDDDDDLTFGINDDEEFSQLESIKKVKNNIDLERFNSDFSDAYDHTVTDRSNTIRAAVAYKAESADISDVSNKGSLQPTKSSQGPFSFVNQSLKQKRASSHTAPVEGLEKHKRLHSLNSQKAWKNFNVCNITSDMSDLSSKSPKANGKYIPNLPAEKIIKRKGRPPKNPQEKKEKKEKERLEKERRKMEKELKKKKKKELKNKILEKSQAYENESSIASSTQNDILYEKPETELDIAAKYLTGSSNEYQQRARSVSETNMLKNYNFDYAILDLKGLNLSRLSDVVTGKKFKEAVNLISNEEALAMLEMNMLAKKAFAEKKKYLEAVRLVNEEYKHLAKFYNMSETREFDHLNNNTYKIEGYGRYDSRAVKDVEYGEQLTKENEILKRIKVLQDKFYSLSDKSHHYSKLKELEREIKQVLEEGNETSSIDLNSCELKAYELRRLKNSSRIKKNSNLSRFVDESVPLIEQSWMELMSKVNNLESFLKFQKEIITRCDFDEGLPDSEDSEDVQFKKTSNEFLKSVMHNDGNILEQHNKGTKKEISPLEKIMNNERKRIFTSSDDDKTYIKRRKRISTIGDSSNNSQSDDQNDDSSLRNLNIFSILDNDDDFQTVTNHNFSNLLQQLQSKKASHYSEDKLMKLVNSYMSELSKRKSTRRGGDSNDGKIGHHIQADSRSADGGIGSRYRSTANINSSEGDSATNTSAASTPSAGRGRPRKKVNNSDNNENGSQSSGYYGGSAPPVSGSRGGRVKKDLQIYGLSNDDIERDLAVMCNAPISKQ